MAMGSDRKAGIAILTGLFVLILCIGLGYFFGPEIGFGALLVIVLIFAGYLGLIATVYDMDPFEWTENKIESYLNTRTMKKIEKHLERKEANGKGTSGI